MKICTKCKVEKSYSEFFKRKKSADGYQFRCKECFNDQYTLDMRKAYLSNNHKRLNRNAKAKYKEKGCRVYCYVDKLTQEVVYVGSTSWGNHRGLVHKRAAGSVPIFHALIKENGYDRYEYRILEIIESPQSLKVREQFYMDLYQPICNIKKAKA